MFLGFFVYSYNRIQPNTWSGAYQCWGKENREAPLRTACPPGIPLDLVSNFEIKSFDACANPHLGLAAIVAAGIDGLRRSLTLPEPTGTKFLIIFFFFCLSQRVLDFQCKYLACKYEVWNLEKFTTSLLTIEYSRVCLFGSNNSLLLIFAKRASAGV